MQGQSIKNQIYEAILRDILDGAYPPNAIINEKALVEKYKVSKSPVREALVQLCGQGILNNIPRFGYQLSVITPGEIREIIEFRKLIELGGLERCFHSLTSDNIAELKALNDETGKNIYNQNAKIHWECNQAFHRTLCGFSNNRYLLKSLTDALNICTRIANQYFTALWSERKLSDGRDHVQLVQAIEDGNLSAAKEILEMDIEAFRDEIL